MPLTSLEQKEDVFAGSFPEHYNVSVPLIMYCLTQNCTACDLWASTLNLNSFGVLLSLVDVSSFLSALTFWHRPQAVVHL